MRICPDHDVLGCPMTRINRVNGEGPIPCPIMLIGEASGKWEDKKGRPLVGKSGSELTYLYLDKCAGISRANVRIDNLVKCRTNEKDRDPTQAEIDACSQILTHEIFTVQPRFVGLIGRVSTQWLLGNVRMEKVHGFGYGYFIHKRVTVIGPLVGAATLGIIIMPLYHPAYGLHNTTMMRHIMEDFTRFGQMVRGDESVMWRAR